MMTIVNSTISGNDAGSGGGGIQNSGTLSLTNTIIANNPGGDCYGSVTSLGYNLDNDGTCSLNATGDKSNVDPKLGPLQDNGGPTFTHALLPGSPAIDAGNPAAPGSGGLACSANDQRGVARPQGTRCDIGAFEFAPLQSGSLVVTKTGDTNDAVCDTDCSLREALAVASSGDRIDLPAGTYTLTMGSELVISKSLILAGAGDRGTIIQAATEPGVADFRVFRISSGNVAILGVTIRHGNINGEGAGIYNRNSTLTLTNTTISNNRTVFTDTTRLGGGIFNRNATLTLTNSTVSNNTAGNGGGINNNNGGILILIDSTVSGNNSPFGGGIYNVGTADVSNSTVSNNTAGNWGGGILNFVTLTLTNSTVSNNTAGGSGGGIRSGCDEEPEGRCGTAKLTNTIVAGNTASTQPNCNAFTSEGNNLLGDPAGCFRNLASGDLSNVDPMLGPLQDNGGPTLTHALLSGSPAIDAGDDSRAPNADQRDISRPQGEASDIGAYEFEPERGAVSRVADPKDDWIGEPKVGYTDILATSVSDQGPDYFMFAMELPGPIPQTPTDHIGYAWELDLDSNGTFNETTDRNVRVAFDPNSGWQGHVDGPDPFPVLSSFEIMGNTVRLTVPRASLGNPQSFNWLSVIPVTGGQSDRAPNTGFATWPSPEPV